jgi:hypothetical protein
MGAFPSFFPLFVAMSHYDWPIKKKNESLEGFPKKRSFYVDTRRIMSTSILS